MTTIPSTYGKRARSAHSGFTLIEVMVSVFVFALIGLIFVGTITTSMRASSLNGQYAQATSLCQHKIDQMRAVGFGRLTYDELSDAGIIDDDPASEPYSFNQVDGVASYLQQPSTSLTLDPQDADTMMVTVNIRWKKVPHENRTSSMSLCALITNSE